MDDLDRASEQETMMRDKAIDAARNKPRILTPNGNCYNCKAALIDTDTAQSCFCDCDCRDDWQRRERAGYGNA